MPKFHGRIGFAVQQQIEPGVWDNVIVERPYFGEVIRDTLEVVGGQAVVSESKTANSFRIVADLYASDNFMDMEYVLWRERYFTVTQVQVEARPRMIVRIGGVYNGPKAPVAGNP